jgi:hypothetical protein
VKRHRFDPYSFVFGLTFLVVGTLLLDTDVDLASFSGAGWLPLPAVVLGVVLLAVGLDRARPPRSDTAPPDAPTEEIANP